MKTKRLHIFKAGTHISQDGSTVTMTFRDLLAVANHYNPKISEAPIVIGHPKTNAPAYGWVSKLHVTSEGLEAEVDQVDEAFASMVKAGRYKKVSASFYSPASQTNPVPGSYYLRHVGFLGAQLPAIKGLRQYAFSENDDAVTFDINQENREMKREDSLLNQIKKLLMQLMGTLPAEEDDEAESSVDNNNQKMLAEKGAKVKKAADKESEEDTQADSTAKVAEDGQTAVAEAVLDKTLDQPEKKAVTDQVSDEDEQSVSDDGMNEEETLDIDAIEKTGEADSQTLTKLVGRIKALEKQLAQQLALVEKNEAEGKKQEASNFAESLVASGRILPYQKDRVIEVMLTLDETSVVNFSEGQHESLKEACCSLLSSLPKSGPVCGVFSSKQAASLREGVTPSSASHDFSEAQDISRLNLHREIEDMAKKENISYEQAAMALSKMR